MIPGTRWARRPGITIDSFKLHLHEMSLETNSHFAWSWRTNLVLEDIDLVNIEHCIGIANEIRTVNATNDSAKKSLLQINWNDSIRLFSNDLKSLKKWCKRLGIGVVTEAITGKLPHDVKYFVKEPPHKHRMYLRSRKVSSDWKESFRELIDRYKSSGSDLYPSASLTRFLYSDATSWWGQYCTNSHFVDYEDESMASIISMTIGNQYISKMYKLEKKV